MSSDLIIKIVWISDLQNFEGEEKEQFKKNNYSVISTNNQFLNKK